MAKKKNINITSTIQWKSMCLSKEQEIILIIQLLYKFEIMQYNTINVIETAVTRNDKNINNSIEKYMSI